MSRSKEDTTIGLRRCCVQQQPRGEGDCCEPERAEKWSKQRDFKNINTKLKRET